jgi:hypothetical protein
MDRVILYLLMIFLHDFPASLSQDTAFKRAKILVTIDFFWSKKSCDTSHDITKIDQNHEFFEGLLTLIRVLHSNQLDII